MSAPDENGPDDHPSAGRPDEDERYRRCGLVLGGPAEESLGSGLSGDDAAMDGALAALYDSPDGRGGGEPADGRKRSAGLGASAPRVARWLGDIRTYFPSTVVQVMQRDAIERLNLTSLLLEPELLA